MNQKNILIIIVFLSIFLFFEPAYGLTNTGTFTPIPTANQPPQFSNFSLSNGSVIRVKTYNWSLNISDYQTFNWTIECSNGQNNSGNDSVNGTFHVNLSGLVYNTLYTVWVNATDGNDTRREFYIFTVLPPIVPSTSGGGGFYVPPPEEEPAPAVTAIDEGAFYTTGGAILGFIFLLFLVVVYKRRKKKNVRRKKI